MYQWMVLLAFGFFVCLNGEIPNVSVETGLLNYLVFKTSTKISHFDGLTVFYYYSSNITLYQANQFTLSLGTRATALDFMANTPPQMLLDNLIEPSPLSHPYQFDECGSWIAGLDYIESQGIYVAFYHGESRPFESPLCSYSSSEESYKAMGLAISYDKGATFTKPFPNEILSSPTNRSGDGTYFKSSLFPDYRFMLYIQDDKPCIARASVSCLNESTCWVKYYNGGWNSPGLGGSCDTIGEFIVPASSKYVVEFAHSDGNYLMATEVSQYGGTHLYFTKATNPEGPWARYPSPVLFHTAYNAPSSYSESTMIYLNPIEPGNSRVIQEGEQFIIGYTLQTSNLGTQNTESLIAYQPITLWGNPSPSNCVANVTLNPIRTYILDFSGELYTWTTNFIYSPASHVQSSYSLGYIATSPISTEKMVLLYYCIQQITNGGSSAMVTDVTYTSTPLGGPLSPPPSCSNTPSQYIGYAFPSPPSGYNTQEIFLCATAGSYSKQFHFLSGSNSCYNIGKSVTSFWIFNTYTGH